MDFDMKNSREHHSKSEAFQVNPYESSQIDEMSYEEQVSQSQNS